MERVASFLTNGFLSVTLKMSEQVGKPFRGLCPDLVHEDFFREGLVPCLYYSAILEISL